MNDFDLFTLHLLYSVAGVAHLKKCLVPLADSLKYLICKKGHFLKNTSRPIQVSQTSKILLPGAFILQVSQGGPTTEPKQSINFLCFSDG